MEVIYQACGGSLTFKSDCSTPKEAFEFVAGVAEVFSERCCGLCGSDAIRPDAREFDGNAYYKLLCEACGATLDLGQNRDGGNLFVKRRDKDTKAPLPNGGWYQYVANGSTGNAGTQQRPAQRQPDPRAGQQGNRPAQPQQQPQTGSPSGTSAARPAGQSPQPGSQQRAGEWARKLTGFLKNPVGCRTVAQADAVINVGTTGMHTSLADVVASEEFSRDVFEALAERPQPATLLEEARPLLEQAQ